MRYKYLEDIIIKYIGDNGVEACGFEGIHKALDERHFLKCHTIIDACSLLNDEQKAHLKTYINTYINAC